VSARLLQDARLLDARVDFQFEDSSASAPDFSLEGGAVAELLLPVVFDAPETEQAPSTTTTAQVSVFLPVHLTAGTTQTEATTAIGNALAAHLSTRAPDAPLTFDSLAAAVRDDSRYALVRVEGRITIEAGERFQQLADGAGEYRPGPGEVLQKSDVAIDVREGEV
jgi:hypothetical protein